MLHTFHTVCPGLSDLPPNSGFDASYPVGPGWERGMVGVVSRTTLNHLSRWSSAVSRSVS